MVDIILRAADKAIPKKGKRCGKPFWNDKCEAAVQERNSARREAENDKAKLEESKAKDKEAKTIIDNEKLEFWKERVSRFDMRTKPKEVRRTIQSMSGKKSSTANPAMKSGNEVKFSDKDKAKILIQQYEKEGKISTNNPKWERNISRQWKNQLETECTTCHGSRDEDCRVFAERELEDAIKRLKLMKSPGEDGITNEMIINLPKEGRQMVLSMINRTWVEGILPHEWKTGIIIPILKEGKPAEEPASYRPICLTSNVCKVAERLVLNRMDWIIQKNKLIGENQAGFQKHRCTEDQIIRIQQKVLDGFNSARSRNARSKRTLMVLFDFSKAFDKVWKDGLLWKLIQKGLPTCMIKWIREYLSGRESYVRLNSTQSRKKSFKHGVPQGGVLSPKLFILFIDDIVKDLGPEVEVSLFADDLAVWVQHEDPKQCERLMQLAIRKIEQWAKKWRMELNAAKTEYILFSNWNKESKWEGHLVLNGQQIKRNDTPKFLGVKFDWNMTFTSHVKQVKDKMRQRLRAMRAVSHKRWGCKTEDLRTLFIGFVRSVAEYAGAAWMIAAL